MKAIILDIEGTTTDIRFVHDVLFPYSQKHLPIFIKENESNSFVAEIIASIKNEYLTSKASTESVLELIEQWIKNDQKIPQLKELQGLVWEHGYYSGEYTGHLYADVVPRLKEWKDLGLKLYIYSSGSVKAQKLLFSHTSAGDITPLFDDYFDTLIGHKKEVKSYRNILGAINIPANQVLFLSDNEDELDAAHEAGIATYHLNRDGLYNKSKHKIIETFDEVSFE